MVNLKVAAALFSIIVAFGIHNANSSMAMSFVSTHPGNKH